MLACSANEGSVLNDSLQRNGVCFERRRLFNLMFERRMVLVVFEVHEVVSIMEDV